MIKRGYWRPGIRNSNREERSSEREEDLATIQPVD